MKLFKKTLLFILFVFFSVLGIAQNNEWQLQTLPLLTPWTKQVSPANALPDYPRPQMVRKNWTNLNGLWEYAISDSVNIKMPASQGKILVPYPLESALSGGNKALQPGQKLWYKRTIHLEQKTAGKRYLLHFGAVDFSTQVYVNNRSIGSHIGGFQEFSFDITAALVKGKNEVVVAVTDPTDFGTNPRGKQALKPQGIMYTAVSGIWQTVWMETVSDVYIKSLRITPDVDGGMVHVEASLNDDQSKCNLEVYSSLAGSKAKSSAGSVQLPVPNGHLWSPEDPFLYDLTVRIVHDGKVSDSVTSYFGMRKIEIKQDAYGQERIYLNNKYTFNLGVLDQGYWPDGIFTAPTDSALIWDVQIIKQMGFNTIRKHIKIEPARWYYHCDRLGMLVWQDMPYPANRTAAAKAQFEKENEENVNQLYNYPSIITWVLFNEGWNQYDQHRLTTWMQNADMTRLINGHSGENYDKTSPSALQDKWMYSDMTDIHDYPGPGIAPYIKGKIRVLGEWGGVRVPTLGHKWNNTNGWGYIEKDASEFERTYNLMMKHLKVYEEEGLSGAIYTQPFDVEIEENGFITYDRQYFKISLPSIQKINKDLLKQRQ